MQYFHFFKRYYILYYYHQGSFQSKDLISGYIYIFFFFFNDLHWKWLVKMDEGEAFYYLFTLYLF